MSISRYSNLLSEPKDTYPCHLNLVYSICDSSTANYVPVMTLCLPLVLFTQVSDSRPRDPLVLMIRFSSKLGWTSVVQIRSGNWDNLMIF